MEMESSISLGGTIFYSLYLHKNTKKTKPELANGDYSAHADAVLTVKLVKKIFFKV